MPTPFPYRSNRGSECDSNYEGACVPAGASDVDFAGGSGNGAEYVSGPVYVVGDDIYELDRDGDGVACEPTN
ncbi:G5 domain-containing protein [Mycolicibacterium novocastrense]|uniref:G5 domain-containing protein n=1 Tax=Mycolicibacterium novocastrense TaxID=59813 RepID=A0ABQ0KQ55_MYCNV|nr:G5 domain-containing protein [Mycolicibacterium novocastrense]